AGATISVSVELLDDFVRVEVEDPGDVAIVAVAPDREHGGGFGLYLVETLAQRWDSRHDGCTCVWAELAIAPAACGVKSMSTLKELQSKVALRMRRGDTFASVE